MRCGSVFKLGGMLFLIAVLLLYFVPATAVAEESASAVADPKTALCKGLKPFTNLDELLYQIYINMESDCLFNMPVEELEKAWGTRMAAYPRDKGLMSDYRPFESEKYGFYIKAPSKGVRGQDSFKIFITEEYYDKYHTLFPDGKFPSLLPPPRIYNNPDILISPQIPPPPQPAVLGEYRNLPYMNYQWVNSRKTQVIELYGYDYSVTNIHYTRYSETPGFLK